MKVIKKTKERILSFVLTFVMVLSSMAGLAPMEVNAEITPPTTTLTYEVVGGSGSMDSEILNVGEVFTVPEPTFEPEDHLFYGWIVEDENGDLVAVGYSNPEFTVQEGKTYTATAYYGYPLTVKNLPDGASVMTRCETLGNPNAVVVPGFAGSAKEEGNMFVIASDSMDSVPTLKVENARAYCIGASEGQYMFFLRYITGPVTVTLMDAPEVSGNIEQKENVTITKLAANEYEVAGIEEEDGFTWVYNLGSVNEGQDVKEKVASELSDWLSCEKGKYVELKNIWGIDDDPYIISDTFMRQEIDDYGYVQIFKLDAQENVHEVAVLPLPKEIGDVEGGAPEATECTVTLQFDESMLKDVELSSINAEGTGIVGRTSENGGTVTMPAGGRIQVSSSNYFSVTVGDTGAQPGEVTRGYGMYRCGIQGITKDTTIELTKAAAPGVAPTEEECSVTNNQERGNLFISNNTDKVVYCKIMDENGNKFTDWFQIEGGKYGNISTSRYYSGTYYVYTCFADYYDGYGEPEENLVYKIPFTIAPPVPPTAEDVSIDTSHPGVLHFKKLNNKKIYSKITDTEGNVIKKWSADLCYVPVDMTTSFGPLEAGEYIVHLCYETAYREEDTEEAAVAQFPVTVTGADLKEGYLDTEKNEYIIDYKDGEKVLVAIAKNHLTGGEGIAKYYTQDEINWYKLPDDEQVRIVVTNSDPSVSPKSFIGYFEGTERLGDELGADYWYEFDFNVTFRDVSIEDPEETDEAVHFGGGDIKLTIDGNVYVEDLYNWDKLEVLGEGKDDILTAGHVNLRNGYVGLEIRDLKKFAIKDRGEDTGGITVTYGAATFSNIDEMTFPENAGAMFVGKDINFKNIKKFTLISDGYTVRAGSGQNVIFENSFGTITTSSEYGNVFSTGNNVYVVVDEETEIKSGLNAETATAITLNEDNSVSTDDYNKYFEIVGEYTDPTPDPTGPVITTHPADVTVAKDEVATFSVEATGENLTYQWQVLPAGQDDWIDFPGETNPTYSVTVLPANNGAKYRCVVKNAEGTVTSNAATLTVTIPTITTYTVTFDKTGYPEDDCWASGDGVDNAYIKFEENGDSATVEADSVVWVLANEEFKVTADGATVGQVQPNTEEGASGYEAKITGFTKDTTIVVTKINNDPDPTGPVITTHPADVTVNEGETATFSVEATGDDLQYQWKLNGTDISGATSASYTTSATTVADNGNKYQCVVTNAGGSVTSNEATLTVTTPTPPSHTHTSTAVPAKTATCTTDGNNEYYKCGCGKFFKDAECTTETTEEAEKIPAAHSWVEDAWEKDTTNHWHKCSKCTETKATAGHTNTNGDNACDICGYEETSTPPSHTHTTTEVPAKAATCTTAGNNKYYKCDCGKFFKDAEGTTETTVAAEVIPAAHLWVENAWVTDGTSHWHKCNNCTDKKDVVSHGDANADKACDVCGYKPSTTTPPADTPAEVEPEEVEKNELKINEGLKVDQKGSKITAKWGKVSDADGYKVYAQYCGKNFKVTPNAVVKGAKNNSVTIKKINGKKLDLKKNYKFYVVAYKIVDGQEVELGRSITAHIVGRKNTKYTNVKKVNVKKSKFTLKVNKTATIKASTVLVSKNKKQLTDAHAKEFRYATSNEKVATVTAKGKIKAVGKGKCTIYVYARNGYCKKVSVTVK